MRLTSPANSSPLPDSAASKLFDFSSRMRDISPTCRETLAVNSSRPAGDVARNVCANSGERALGLRCAAADYLVVWVAARVTFELIAVRVRSASAALRPMASVVAAAVREIS